MATIAEYPDDPKFTIKIVCTQTGILPVTLRAWERRHDVLAPQRAENHYRLYSERDVAILRWVKSRIDSGISISNAVNELRELRQKGLWPEAIPVAPKMMDHKTKGDAKRFSHQLYEALIHHNEYEAGSVLQEIHKTFDLRTICMDIITPSLIEIGEAWYRGEIRVTTEHFACAFLRGRLLSLMQTFPCRRNNNFLLVGCAPSEQHEIGAIMFTVLLRSNCFQVEYLGPDVPLEDLVDYAKYEHPGAVILTASTETTALELKHLNDQLCQLKRAPIFAYAGRAFIYNPHLRRTIAGVYLGDNLDQGMECIQSLLLGEHPAKPTQEKQN